jgi:hypothetical protein
MLYTIKINWPNKGREQKPLIALATEHQCFISSGVVKGESMEEIMSFGRAHFTDMTDEQIQDLVVEEA